MKGGDIMKSISIQQTRKLVSVGIFGLVTFLTLGTSVMGMTKVAGSFKDTQPAAPEIKQEVLGEKTEIESDDSVTPNKTVTTGTQKTANAPTALATNTSVKSSSPKTITTPVNPTAAAPAQQNANTGCIITLFGKQYDVTTLQNTHSGGNIFNCGTDMTASYQSQHGSNVSRMQQYLVTGSASSSTTPSGNTSGGSTNTSGGSVATSSHSSNDDDDEEDEDEHEEEHEEEDESEDH